MSIGHAAYFVSQSSEAIGITCSCIFAVEPLRLIHRCNTHRKRIYSGLETCNATKQQSQYKKNEYISLHIEGVLNVGVAGIVGVGGIAGTVGTLGIAGVEGIVRIVGALGIVGVEGILGTLGIVGVEIPPCAALNSSGKVLLANSFARSAELSLLGRGLEKALLKIP